MAKMVKHPRNAPGVVVLAPQAGGARARSFWHVLVGTNHKDIGTLYILLAVLGGCVGGVLAMLSSLHLVGQGHDAESQGWTLVMTAHGLVMVFWFAMPALIGGMGNWFVPLMLGAADTAFPRLNALGVWLLALGFVCVVLGALLQTPNAAVFLFVSVQLAGLSALLGAINFIVTIFNMRAVGLCLHKMPLFCWSILVTSFLLLLAVPVLAGAVTLLLAHHSPTFLLRGDGARLFAHLFWFFGHPEAYIIILPAIGIISQIISTFARRPLVGALAVAYAMVAIGLLGFVVWAHRVFIPSGLEGYFRAAPLLIAVPGVVPFVSWIVTLYRGRIMLKTPMLWALGFICLFVIGGLMGVGMEGTGRLGRYMLVAHLHYMLSMGAAFAIFAGFYYWVGKITGRSYPEFWGKLHFWTFFIGVNLTFFPMQFSHLPDWAGLSAVGALLSGVSSLIFVYVVWRVFISRWGLAADYWGNERGSLEWSVPSPVPYETFIDLPVVR